MGNTLGLINCIKTGDIICSRVFLLYTEIGSVVVIFVKVSIGGYGYVIGCATVRRMLRRRDARKICSLLHTLIYNVAMVTDNSYKTQD